jgi:hypothetical protein
MAERRQFVIASFCEKFHGAILEGDWPEGVGGAHTVLLGQEDAMSSIQAHIVLQHRPKLLVERWAKTVGTRADIHVHCEQGPRDFFHGNWGREVVQASDIEVGVKVTERETPSHHGFGPP